MEFKVLKNESYKVGNIQKQRVVIKQSDNEFLDLNDIKNIAKQLEAKYVTKHKKEPKMLIRGLGIAGTFTLKAYDEPIDEMFEDIDDYLHGRVKESTNFSEFAQVEISFYT